MKNLKYILLLLLLPSFLTAQKVQSVQVGGKGAVADSSFRIEYITTDSKIPGYLNVHVRLIVADTIPADKYLQDSLLFGEGTGDGGSMTAAKLQKVVLHEKDLVTVMMDVSSSMWKSENGRYVHMDSAKVLVDSILKAMDAPYAARIYTYDEQLYNRTVVGENSFQTVEKPLDVRYTHLWENVSTALERMAAAKGRKILIVIGDGENDHNRSKEETVTKEKLLEQIRGLDSSYYIFPIRIGGTTYPENLQALVDATQVVEDSVYRTARIGQGMFQVLKKIEKHPITHTLLLKSELHPHAGEERMIVARLEGVSDTATYRLGGLFNPWHEESTWQLNTFVGGLVVLILFFVFVFIVPSRRWKDFKSKYVRQYWEVKKGGERRYDPLTKFPFRDEDFVVLRCEHMTSLETWQYEGRSSGKDNNRKRKNRCIYYPHQCESGQGPGGASDFFGQIGTYKQMFWVFAGVFGAFLGWGLWALFETATKTGWNKWMDAYAASPEVQGQWGLLSKGVALEDSVRLAREQFVNPFFEQIVLGACAVVFVVFFIAMANEISQARSGFRGWNLVLGLLRSLARAFSASGLGAVLFYGFGLLQAHVFVKNPYLPGLATMMLLGLSCGWLLCIRSGVRIPRGLWSGLLAGFVGFHLYFLSMWLFGAKGYEIVKLFMFVGFGAILGLLLSQGAPALEASEIEVWTGFKRFGKSHITDLLRKNEEVTVGRGPTATIRIKVRHTPSVNAPGNVVQTFARFIMRNEVVYLVPEVFTEVNGEAVAPNERVPLFSGDKISFAHKSPAHLRYVEHRAGLHPRWRAKKRRDRQARRARAKALSARVRNRAKESREESSTQAG